MKESGVNISIDTINNSPVFDAEQCNTEKDEQDLFGHYGKPINEN